MNKTETVRARMQPNLKNSVENIFRELGLNTTQAVTLFYKQVELRNGLPFEVVIPNKANCKVFKNIEKK